MFLGVQLVVREGGSDSGTQGVGVAGGGRETGILGQRRSRGFLGRGVVLVVVGS